METEKKNNRLEFRGFLDKSTNLITVFGVFNALFVYSTTIEDGRAALFLMTSFFCISILVWFELFMYTIDSNDDSWKYKVFYFLLAMVGIGLGCFFYVEFPWVLAAGITLAIFWLFIFGFVTLLAFLFKKRLATASDKKKRFALFIFCIIALSIFFGSMMLIDYYENIF